MRILQQSEAVLIFDLSNVVARAQAVAGADWLKLYTRMLLKQRKKYRNHRFIFAVEGAGTIARQKIVPEYKAGRVPTPEFQSARKLAIEMARCINCSVLLAPDGEADDAIASFVSKNPNADITIVSNDRDLWQLIQSNVVVRAQVVGTTTTIDRFACVRHIGVLPEAVPVLKALCGDKSDNIPRGVPKVHEKKLKRLAQLVTGVEEQLCQVARESDFLTDADKKKIQDAYPVVKLQLKVTTAWRNLKLKERKCKGNTGKLKKFLDIYSVVDSFDDGDIKKIVGESK